MPCKLLVSVRNAQEARAALDGGADIIDVKEPSRGSLGMADVDTIQTVAAAVRDFGCAVPVSAAFGEAIEWLDGAGIDARRDVNRRGAHRRRGLRRVDYAKLGLAALGRDNWALRWQEARRLIEERYRPRNWIAVVYADRHEADAPCPQEVIHLAAQTGCAGVLFDTKTKDGRTLLDWLPPEELGRLCVRVQESRLTMALAGRLTPELLPQIMGIDAEVLGIRSAACEHHSRSGRVNSATVRRFKTAMMASWMKGSTNPAYRGRPPCTVFSL